MNAGASWISTSLFSFVIYLSGTGVAYGLSWTLFYILFGSYFKKVPPSQLFAIASILAPGVGPISMNSVAGLIYDHYGHKTSNGLTCEGEKCYHLTFVISFACSLVGWVLLVALWIYRTKKTSPDIYWCCWCSRLKITNLFCWWIIDSSKWIPPF